VAELLLLVVAVVGLVVALHALLPAAALLEVIGLKEESVFDLLLEA